MKTIIMAISNNPHYTRLHQAYETWLDSKTKFNDITITNYVRWTGYFLAYLTAFKRSRLNDVDNDIVYQFTHFRHDPATGETKAYAKASVQSRLSALELFFTWAYEQGHCRENPILRYKKAQLKSRPLIKAAGQTQPTLIILDADEVNKLKQLKTKGDYSLIRDKCIVLLILASAIYAEELIKLSNNDLKLKKGYVILENEPKPLRKIPLELSLCKAACEDWLKVRRTMRGAAKQDLLFFNQQAQPLSKRMLYKIVSQTLSAAGIVKAHPGPDLLRQTAICQLLEKYPLEEVQKISGIKNLERYQQYIQLKQSGSFALKSS